MHTNCLIIGSGAAGYTAAIYAARANLSPIIVQGMQPGGQLTITTDVENYPGFSSVVQGPWLMEEMRQQALHMGTTIVEDLVAGVNFTTSPFVVNLDSGEIITADTIIIATGAQAKWLGLDSEEYYRGAGVSACATCDGFFFRGKTVAVVGGGNTAVEEAIYLTNHAKKVYVIHRRDSFRAEHVMQERLFKNPKIEVLWNSQVIEILGVTEQGIIPRKEVTGLFLEKTDGSTYNIDLDGVFVAIGHQPATQVFVSKERGGASILPEETSIVMSDGYIYVKPGTTQTALPGVFAAGDVTDKHYRQAITAAGMGCMAALDAERWLAHR